MKTKFYTILLILLAFNLVAFSQWSSVQNPNSSSVGTSVVVDQLGNIYTGGYTFKDATQKNNYFIVKYSPSGNILWTKEYDNANNDDQLIEMLIDKDNNLLVTGNTKATTEDILTLKFSPDGTLLKTYNFDGTNRGADKATYIHTDKNGNYYISGISKQAAYYGYVAIKTNANLERISAQTYGAHYGAAVMGSSYNAVIDKIGLIGAHTDWENKYLMGTVIYNNDLTRNWASVYRTIETRSAVGFDIHLCDNGEVYTCGYEANAETSVWEAILLKYNSVGETIWTRKIPISGTDISIYKSLVLDPAGNIYVTGVIANKVVTAKYSPNGNLAWIQLQDGLSSYSGRDVHKSIKIDHQGNVLVLARDFHTKGGGIQLIKYSADGQFIWVKYYNGSASGMDEPSTFTIDTNGNSYVVGISRNSSYYLEMVSIQFTPNNPNQLETLTAPTQLSVYPTITQGTIYLQSPMQETTIIEVFSTDGKLAYENNLPANQTLIQLNGLKNGLYYVKLSNQMTSHTSKIIVKK